MPLFILLKLFLLLNRINAERQPICGTATEIERVKSVIFKVDREFNKSHDADEGNFADGQVYIHDGSSLYRLSIHFKNKPTKYEIDLSVYPVESAPKEIEEVADKSKLVIFDTGISCVGAKDNPNNNILLKNSTDIIVMNHSMKCRKWVSTIKDQAQSGIEKVTWLGSFDKCKGYLYSSDQSTKGVIQTALQLVNGKSIDNDPFPSPFFKLFEWPDAVPDFLIPYRYKDREGFFDIGLWSNGSWIYLRASPWKYHSYSGKREQLLKYEKECVNYPTEMPLTTRDPAGVPEITTEEGTSKNSGDTVNSFSFQFTFALIYIRLLIY